MYHSPHGSFWDNWGGTIVVVTMLALFVLGIIFAPGLLGDAYDAARYPPTE